MKNTIIVSLFLMLTFSVTLNIVLWQEMCSFRSELQRMIMPVGDDDLEKLMEEIKNLSNTDINAGNDT
jgi:hypothetical protein